MSSSDVARSVARNTTVLFGSYAVTGFSSFILILFLPRLLGSEAYGRLYLAISVTMIFQILIDFGGSYFVAKEIARDRAQAPSLLVNSIALRSLLWVGSLVLMVLFALSVGYTMEVTLLILILGVAKLWESAAKILHGCFLGFEAMQYTSIAAIAERIFLMVAGVSALLLGGNVLTIAGIMTASTLLGFLICAKFLRRFVPALPRWDTGNILRIMKMGVPYFMYSIFGVIYYRVDAIMLSLWTSDAVVGWYGAAYRFFDILMFLPSIFSLALFPVLSRMWGKEYSSLERTTHKSLEFILMAGIPLSVAIFSFAPEIIQFFFNMREYAPSIPLLRIFAVGMLLVYIDVVIGTVLLASDKQRQWSVVAFFAMLVNIGLNTLLIPFMHAHTGNGGLGAAISTLVTEFFVMCGALTLLPPRFFRTISVTVQLKTLVSATCMAASLWLLPHAAMPWGARLALGVTVYLTTLLFIKTLAPAELSFLRSFLTFTSLKSVFLVRRESHG